jgi:NAD(P)-dependent dehydrogenase (short-subunit alcohol dehydrogenase family)
MYFTYELHRRLREFGGDGNRIDVNCVHPGKGTIFLLAGRGRRVSESTSSPQQHNKCPAFSRDVHVKAHAN